VHYHWDYATGNSDDIKVTANTQWTLYTGGKAVINASSQAAGAASGSSSQNLFSIYTDANGASSYEATPTAGWYGTPINGLSGPQVEVLGHPMGNDYIRWTVQPDNTAVLLGVAIPSKNHSTIILGEGKYHPYIGLATGTTNANLDTDIPEVCVGQQATFTLHGLPSYIKYSAHWGLPQPFVNESWQNQCALPTTPPVYVDCGSINYDVNADLLTNLPSTACWFTGVSGGNVTVGADLYFSNGQQAFATARGKISVFRPKSVMVNPHTHGTPSVIWETPWYTVLGTEHGAIQLGVPSGANNMGYICRVISADFGGEAKITQICNIDASGFSAACAGCLDGGDPYSPDADVGVIQNANPKGGSNELIFDDSPDCNTTMGELYMTDSFVDYIMFNPKTTPNDIFVTLGTVTWDVSASAVFPNATISQTVDGPTGPDSNNQLPQWTDVFVDHNN
jgi:hypothetical protein